MQPSLVPDRRANYVADEAVEVAPHGSEATGYDRNTLTPRWKVANSRGMGTLGKRTRGIRSGCTPCLSFGPFEMGGEGQRGDPTTARRDIETRPNTEFVTERAPEWSNVAREGEHRRKSWHKNLRCGVGERSEVG